MFPFPANVADWLSWVFCRFQANGVLLPGEPAVNYLSPLVAVDNPSNGTIDVSMTGSVLAYAGEASTSTFAIAANTSVALNTSANVVVLKTPGTPTPGTMFAVTDVALFVETNQATLTDTTNSYLIQNPIDLGYYATLTWGTGSGGGTNPNLPKGFGASWRQMTKTIASVTTPVWAVAR